MHRHACAFHTRFCVKNRYLLPLVLTAVLLAGCENTFSPKAPFEERIVVFSVLDPTLPYQSVRLESTYDAALGDEDNPINQQEITEEVEVSIRGNDRNYVFTDTLITLADGGQKRLWINRDLIPSEGVAYRLTVHLPERDTEDKRYELTATTTVPSRAYIQLDQTIDGLRLSAIENVSYPGSAFHFRMWVRGTKMVDGKEVDVRREVPYREEDGEIVFSEPSRHTVRNYQISRVVTTQNELRSIDKVFGGDVIATAYTLDKFIYSYYKLVRGFDDPVSVRQDRPDVTNIRNGVGIFGAVYPDSLVRKYNTLIQQ